VRASFFLDQSQTRILDGHLWSFFAAGDNRPDVYVGLLEEYLKPLGISQSAFAIRLGVSFPRLNEIVRQKRSVTPDTALRLARVLGMPADFWLGLQQDWDLWRAMRSEQGRNISNVEPLAQHK
jgi:addiction module HigA family antidote